MNGREALEGLVVAEGYNGKETGERRNSLQRRGVRAGGSPRADRGEAGEGAALGAGGGGLGGAVEGIVNAT